MDGVVEAVWGKIINPVQTFIIAEAGVNHGGTIEQAKRLVDVAVDAGADAVKFQTFNARRLVTSRAPKADYQKRTTGTDESQLEMLDKLELSPHAHEVLRGYCRNRGILFLSSPFDEESADYLDVLEVPLFKIPSGEITNLPYLLHLARKGKPLILSTGMASLGEVESALQIIETAGNRRICILHCVSNYPADPADCNLRAMETMRQAFHVPVGYSDHTEGIVIAQAAAAIGAAVIEKHFTLDRSLPGPDHQASIEPEELALLVRNIRTIESAMGTGRKALSAAEKNTAMVARKSLVAARDIPAGEVLTDDCIILKRPGTGLPASLVPYILGRRSRQPISAGSILSLEMFL